MMNEEKRKLRRNQTSIRTRPQEREEGAYTGNTYEHLSKLFAQYRLFIVQMNEGKHFLPVASSLNVKSIFSSKTNHGKELQDGHINFSYIDMLQGISKLYVLDFKKKIQKKNILKVSIVIGSKNVLYEAF